MHYENPPIKEALISLKIDYDFNDEKIKALIEELKSSFPIVLDELQYEMTLPPSRKQPSVSTKSPYKKLFSQDKKDVIQILHQNLTFSRLAPYLGWDSFTESFNKILSCFKKQFELKISRVGVRSINNFFCSIKEFNECTHIKTAINLDSPDYLIDRTTQQFILSLKNKYNGIIFFMVDPVKRSEQIELNVVFDIDVFKVLNEPMDNSKLKHIISDMRGLKNDLFESNLSNKLKEKFNPEKNKK